MPTETRHHSEAAVRRRAERQAEKRRIILNATLDLIMEGELDPTIQQIVERCDISERSVFRYFDKSQIAHEALLLAAEDHAELGTVDNPGVGDLDSRIDRYVTARVRLLEEMIFPARAARIHVAAFPSLKEALTDNAAARRGQLGVHFAPEVDRLDPTEGQHLLDVVTQLTSFDAYDVSRDRLGRSPESIGASWRSALRRLLA